MPCGCRMCMRIVICDTRSSGFQLSVVVIECGFNISEGINTDSGAIKVNIVDFVLNVISADNCTCGGNRSSARVGRRLELWRERTWGSFTVRPVIWRSGQSCIG